MNRTIFEDNKYIRREISRDLNLLTYRLTFKLPITVFGFVIGRKNVWIETSYPVFENDPTSLEKIASYCAKKIDEQRRRSRKRRKITIDKMKAYEHTIRPHKTNSKQEA